MRDWYRRLTSEGDGEPSIRRNLCFWSVALAWALCFAGLWRDVPAGAIDLAKAMVGLAIGAVTVGRFAEAMDRK